MDVIQSALYVMDGVECGSREAGKDVCHSHTVLGDLAGVRVRWGVVCVRGHTPLSVSISPTPGHTNKQ